jgi:nucleoside-diphosphate-sugar epimerase
VSADEAPVRSRRSPARGNGRGTGRRGGGSVVAVTGAASGVGALLTERLAAHDEVRKVIAVDDVRGEATGVTWRIVDVTSPTLVTRLSGVDTVVHLAIDTGIERAGDSDDAAQPPTTGAGSSGRNVRGTQAVLTAAAAAGVRRVVLCTSAMVYGALPDNPVPLEEDAPLRAEPDGALVAELLEIEELAARAPRAHPGLSVTVVRPAVLVGPGIDSLLTRHFEAPRLLVLRGTHPRWQFCHVDDLASALELAALGAVEGVVTVGCEGWLDQEQVERLSGIRRIELPSTLAFGTAERLHRLGVVPAPASDLQYVVHPWVVPSTRLRAAGWRPAYDNETALGALLEQVSGHHAVAARRLGRKDATLGAAGAAVAVVGTAAMVRRARRRRRG